MLPGRSLAFRGTLTLPAEWSLVLAGFFALLITVIQGYLWSIITFCIHQMNASSKPQRNSYHQLQLILRNSDTEGTFVTQLRKILWVNRGSRFQGYRKSIALMLFAVMHSLTFLIAGGFSSEIIAARDPSVLSVSRHCGWIQEPTFENPEVPTFDNIYSLPRDQLVEWINAVSVVSRTFYRRSASYSRTCYGRLGDNSTVCGNLVQPTLPYTVRHNVPCPFNDKACNGTAVSLDTGRLRSDTHLGVNTRPEDAMSFRKVLTCVPLAGESYTDGWQAAPPDTAADRNVPAGTRLKSYSFGPLQSYFGPKNPNTTVTVTVDEVQWKRENEPYSLQ